MAESALLSGKEDVVFKDYHTPKGFAKYNSALKALIPFRPFTSDEGHPIDRAGMWSVILYTWMSNLIYRTFKKPPVIEELWELSHFDGVRLNYKRLSRLWKNEVKTKGLKHASLHHVVWLFVRTRIIISTVCFLMFGMLTFFVSGFLIRYILEYVCLQKYNISYGLILVVMLLCAEVSRACMLAGYFVLNHRTALRTRAALLLLLFKKAIKIGVTSKTSVGNMITMCSNDGDRVFDAVVNGNAVVLGPLLFLIGTAYLGHLLGPISLIGSFVFVIVIPMQGVVIKLINRLRAKAIFYNEERMNKMHEILSSVKLIKMYAWEDSFSSMIEPMRENELAALRKSAILQSINISVAFLTAIFASVMMLTAYVLLNNQLTAEHAFTVIAVYSSMANSLKFMPIAVKNLADGNIAIKRFEIIFAMDNLTKYVITNTKKNKNAIEVNDASFAWTSFAEDVGDSLEKANCDVPINAQQAESLLTNKNTNFQSPIILKQLNFVIKNGNLVGVYGAFGSGKTSLLSGIMGQMTLCGGSVAVSGPIAYCAQQAWLMNATVRENILFGSSYDKARYRDVVKVCELLKDFEMFQSGDLTEVGEHGINLSGGQKQRISLARAVYSNKDIYLLDDPFSALDAHVGKAVFFEVILKRLKSCGKTVLLVTHQTQYFSYCDDVYQVQDNTLTKVDTVDSLTQNMPPHNYKSDGNTIHSCKVSSINFAVRTAESLEELDLEDKLMTTEETSKSKSFSSQRIYMQAGGGYFVGLLLALFFMINVGSQQFSNLWLSFWLSQGVGEYQFDNLTSFKNDSDEQLNSTTFSTELNIFANSYNLTVSTSPINLLFNHSNFSMSTHFGNNSQRVEDLIFTNILLNPQLHYYIAVYGLSAVVMLLVSVLRGWAYVSITIRASKVLHRSLFETVLKGTMEFFDTTPVGRILNRFQKDMDELDVILPYYLEMFLLNAASLLCVLGLIAYVFPAFFIIIAVILPLFVILYTVFMPSSREFRRLDTLTRSPWFANITTAVTGLDTIRAYGRTSDFVEKCCDFLNQNGVPLYLFVCSNRWLGIRLDVLALIISVGTSILVILNRSIVSPAYAGLALSSAIFFSGMWQLTIRLLTETEARFVCVDRIKYYIDHIPQETTIKPHPVSSNWPSSGKVEFQNVCLRYRDGLPLVLNNICFTVSEGEKIGVVGRTGAGKSSLAVALFRLTELSSGKILIDDQDISLLSLHDLRSRMSVIPQDPVLFSGTVRYNLDPFERYSDADIWFVLEQAHLKNNISKLPGQLDGEVLENGFNFSVGERQLMCLARALLRNCKVLILDEATAAVDVETEATVHEVIDSSFAHCTILTIAHRLSTVVKSDRILVLDRGRVIEFEAPQKLLNDETSAFHKMLKSFEKVLS